MSLDIDRAAERLQKVIRDRYELETAEDRERWGAESLPDFRGDGARLNKFGIILDPKCMCSSCAAAYTVEVVDKLLIFERGLIRGAGGSGNCEEVERVFLKDNELPSVFPLVPPHLRQTPEDIETAKIPEEALGQLRVRHVFGVRAPV